MKSVKNLVAIIALSTLSFGSFAQSITASASSLDGAEAQIAAQAQQLGAKYKITEASSNNYVHMTAELIK
ncbi:YdgH/BhsA/McbA-like domain containing protein [Erwinia billingiae]|uniref:YdgH/BhsA/McbA-like domain containing protein n=1 Tax=Erwinia billingiae TaxID=182337 RepID=UPI0030D43EA1